jgi:ribosomal protein L7/L12
MANVVVWLSVVCIGLLLICLATLGQLTKRAAAISRVEAKLDLLLAKAGIEFDPYSNVSQELSEALRRGDKIAAIKCYRQASGAGLKEAKEHIEELQRRGGL